MNYVSHPMQEKAMANRASNHVKHCKINPKHLLDPTWGDTCPLCEAEKRAKQGKQVYQSSTMAGSQRNPTVVSGGSDQAPRQGTRVIDQDSHRRSSSPPPAREKRIVGVLVTYNRPGKPEGSLFHIREGRNYIGAGNIASEVPERPCDILIPEDGELSKEHALILYRRGSFEIIDNKSINATVVNGVVIPSLQGYPLENYAKITTGRTDWTFIIIIPSKTTKKSATQTEEKPQEKPPHPDERRLR